MDDRLFHDAWSKIEQSLSPQKGSKGKKGKRENVESLIGHTQQILGSSETFWGLAQSARTNPLVFGELLDLMLDKGDESQIAKIRSQLPQRRGSVHHAISDHPFFQETSKD